jgi:hypothetical protein
MLKNRACRWATGPIIRAGAIYSVSDGDGTIVMPRSFMRSRKAALWFFALPFQPKLGLVGVDEDRTFGRTGSGLVF